MFAWMRIVQASSPRHSQENTKFQTIILLGQMSRENLSGFPYVQLQGEGTFLVMHEDAKHLHSGNSSRIFYIHKINKISSITSVFLVLVPYGPL